MSNRARASGFEWPAVLEAKGPNEDQSTWLVPSTFRGKTPFHGLHLKNMQATSLHNLPSFFKLYPLMDHWISQLCCLSGPFAGPGRTLLSKRQAKSPFCVTIQWPLRHDTEFNQSGSRDRLH